VPPTLLRRVVSFSGLGILFVLTVTIGPVALLLTWLFDLITRGQRWRGVALGMLWAVTETAGLIAGLLLTFSGPAPHVWVQRRWAAVLLGGIERIFALRIVVEGEVPSGPIIALVRHSSLAETPLPMMIFPTMSPRYVLKRGLQWDPCLDLFGNRLPNAFVHRGGGAPQVARVEALGVGLTERDMVVIFPEGTRFSEEKRQRRIDGLAGEERARAQALRHTLLPRPGGTLALLGSGANVVVVGHTGFESARTAANLFDGSLVRREIRVRLWTVPAADVVPTEAWLYERWKELDDWLDAVITAEA
jgi:1-acyl-sn-glycerol-3-phosphate acyltransferase